MTSPSPREPVAEPLSLQATALLHIRDAILQGALAPGTRLHPAALAAELGMSPVPVREALQALVTEGLAVHLPRRGMTVSALTAEDVANAYDVMGVLEGLVACEVAGRLTPEDLERLRGLRDEMEDATARGDHDALLRLDREFHACMCEASRNTRARELLRGIWNYTYRVRRVYPRSAPRLRETIGEHRAILEALRAGDGEACERLLRRHIEGARDDLLRQLQPPAPDRPQTPV